MVDLILIAASFEMDQEYNESTIRALYNYIQPATPKLAIFGYLFITIDSRVNDNYKSIRIKSLPNTLNSTVLGKYGRQVGFSPINIYNFNSEYVYRISTLDEAASIGETTQYDNGNKVLTKQRMNSSCNVQFISNSLNGIYSSNSQAIQLRHIKKILSNSSTTYTITWNATTNGGTCDTLSTTIKAGESVGYLPTAIKSGYYNNGWFTSSSGGTNITEDTVPQGNVTYYAQFRLSSGGGDSGGGSGGVYIVVTGGGSTTGTSITSLSHNPQNNLVLTHAGNVTYIDPEDIDNVPQGGTIIYA